MLALINPVALLLCESPRPSSPSLLDGGAYIFRNRHRFFDRDPNVDNDIPARSPRAGRGGLDPVATHNHAYPDSADQFLAGLTSAVVRSVS